MPARNQTGSIIETIISKPITKRSQCLPRKSFNLDKNIYKNLTTIQQLKHRTLITLPQTILICSEFGTVPFSRLFKERMGLIFMIQDDFLV